MIDGSTSPDAAAAVDALSSALDRVGDALANVDAASLAAADAALGAALTAVAGIRSVADRAATIDACRRARVALLRCRRLGATFMSVARGAAPVAADRYDRAGAYLDAVVSTGVLDARI